MANDNRQALNAASASDFIAITPSDTVDLLSLASGLYVGVGGTVVAVTNGGNAITFVGLAAGSVIPIKFKRINATSTTATNLVALY